MLRAVTLSIVLASVLGVVYHTQKQDRKKQHERNIYVLLNKDSNHHEFSSTVKKHWHNAGN